MMVINGVTRARPESLAPPFSSPSSLLLQENAGWVYLYYIRGNKARKIYAHYIDRRARVLQCCAFRVSRAAVYVLYNGARRFSIVTDTLARTS